MERKIRIVNEYGTFSAIEINKAYVECREYIKHYREVIAKQKKQISELEAELKHSREYADSLRGIFGIRSAKENTELANKLYGLNFEVPDDKEPLPLSSGECEKDFLEELRSRDLNFNLVSKMLDVIELMLIDTQR